MARSLEYISLVFPLVNMRGERLEYLFEQNYIVQISIVLSGSTSAGSGELSGRYVEVRKASLGVGV